MQRDLLAMLTTNVLLAVGMFGNEPVRSAVYYIRKFSSTARQFSLSYNAVNIAGFK